MGEKYEYLKKVLDDSHYTVALCGSGILAETGCRTFQNQDYAYEIEQKYGRSPEDIFASAYYMTRPDSFFEKDEGDGGERTAVSFRRIDESRLHGIPLGREFPPV